jgi:predicted NBD/HSP70 family sugar kinase
VAASWVVVGIDTGGNKNNATVLDSTGRFLVDSMVETPSRVEEGPSVALELLVDAFNGILARTGVERSRVRAVGFDTAGPASADGVLSSRGGTNFAHPGWRGFDFRGGLAAKLGLPIVYNNDGNAAALYAHYVHFGADSSRRSSISVVVGTGLGGGLVENGRIIKGASGMGGELGHVHIPMEGLLAPGQPVPSCNCGLSGDAESVASLTAIERSLLPFWLERFPGHKLAGVEPRQAARQVRSLGELGDPLARKVFEQQAIALGHLFSIAARFTDPHAFFVGGGVVEAAPEFREWFLATVRAHTNLTDEQRPVTQFALVPHLDMAGARGAALAALEAIEAGRPIQA